MYAALAHLYLEISVVHAGSSLVPNVKDGKLHGSGLGTRLAGECHFFLSGTSVHLTDILKYGL